MLSDARQRVLKLLTDTAARTPRARWRLDRPRKRGRSAVVAAAVGGALLLGGFLHSVGIRDCDGLSAATFPKPSQSTTIALNRSDNILWVVNREANSVSVFCVRGNNNADLADKLA